LNGIKEQLEAQAFQSRRNVSRRVASGRGGDRRVLSSHGVGRAYPHTEPCQFGFRLKSLMTVAARGPIFCFVVLLKSLLTVVKSADTLVEEGRAISDEEKRWDDRTDRMTFEVRKGDTTVARCGRTVYATPSENKRGGPYCRRQGQQQQSTGQNACGIATTNAGCRRLRKERRQQRVEVSKMKGSGARNALKI
jgi:hypothetical protein